MISSKLFAVVVTASTLWVVDAGKCKPHPKPTSFLTLTSGDSPATSYPVSYLTSSGDDAHVFSSTDPLGSSRLTETVSSDISESSAMPSYQIPTSSPTASDSQPRASQKVLLMMLLARVQPSQVVSLLFS